MKDWISVSVRFQFGVVCIHQPTQCRMKQKITFSAALIVFY